MGLFLSWVTTQFRIASDTGRVLEYTIHGRALLASTPLYLRHLKQTLRLRTFDRSAMQYRLT
jgi:hypothetical protein